MAHDLERDLNGAASLAYSNQHGTPWHRLGTPLDGLQTPAEILIAARADWLVHQAPATMIDPETGKPIKVKGRQVNYRKRSQIITDDGVEGGDIETLGVVSDGYRVIQNHQALQFAYDLAGLDTDTAHVDVAGVLNSATFFAYIRLPDTVIDPNGIADRIATGLAVVTGHSGRQALQVVESRIRTVCRNTVNAALTSDAKISVRHTGTDALSVDEARRILGLHTTARARFAGTVMDLLATPATFDDVVTAAGTVFDYDPETATNTQTDTHRQRIATLEQLWEAPTNSANYGANAWSAFNTVAEFLDHCGRGDAAQHATRSLTSTTTHSRKAKALAVLGG